MSNTFSCCSTGIPIPVSVTESTSSLEVMSAVSVILPPGSVNLKALESRLLMIFVNMSASMQTDVPDWGNEAWNAMFL